PGDLRGGRDRERSGLRQPRESLGQRGAGQCLPGGHPVRRGENRRRTDNLRAASASARFSWHGASAPITAPAPSAPNRAVVGLWALGIRNARTSFAPCAVGRKTERGADCHPGTRGAHALTGAGPRLRPHGVGGISAVEVLALSPRGGCVPALSVGAWGSVRHLDDAAL